MSASDPDHPLAAPSADSQKNTHDNAGATVAGPPPKPSLRGVSHAIAFVLSLIFGVYLVATAPDVRARIACAVYCATVSILFGVSAAYHVPHWSPSTRAWWRRADHSAIYLLIAGTYTPLCLLAIGGNHGVLMLTIVWVGAALGTAKEFLWRRAPKIITVLIALCLGWVGAFSARDLAATIGMRGVVLFLGAGVLYSAGAVIYALKRPNPWPRLFGYHEIFHLLVIAAAAIHLGTIANYVWQLAPSAI